MVNRDYKVIGPDGKEHVINGPDNATDDEIIAQAKSLLSAPPAEPGYLSEAAGGVKRGLNALWEGAKQVVNPPDAHYTPKAFEDKLPIVPRILFNVPATIAQSVENASAQRQVSQRQGGGWQDQAIAYAKELPILGGLMRGGEQAGPGMQYGPININASPKVIGNVAEAATQIEAPRAVAGAISKGTAAATPENLRTLADKAKAIREAPTPHLVRAAGAAIGGGIGYEVSPGPISATAGAAAGATLAGDVVKGAAGGSEAILRKLAAIRESTGAPHFNDPALDVPRNSGYSAEPVDYNAEPTASRVPSKPLTTPKFIQNDLAAMREADLYSNPAYRNTPPAFAPEGDPLLPSKGPSPEGTNAKAQMELERVDKLKSIQNETNAANVAPAVPPDVQKVATALIRRGRGAGGADMAITNAQYLLREMPELATLSDIPDASGVAPFDMALTNRLNSVGAEIGAKLESSAHKTVNTVSAKATLTEIADRAAQYGDGTSATKISKLAKLMGDKGMVKGEVITNIRQGLNDSGLDISEGPGREAYAVFRDLTEKMDPDLKELNQRWFTLKTSSELAKLRTGGKSAESQVGAGTRPGANYKEQQRVEAAKKARAK